MSTTNHTPTIELSQYVSTDKTSYLVNYNDDMLKIDSAIASDRDGITGAQNTADTAEGKADTNKLSIDAINAELNDASTGVLKRLTDVEGDVNTIESLIGNGEPTTTDKTIIGAINELAAEIPSGGTSAADVSYDNTTSGLTADDVQEAIDELAAAIPSAGAVEVQSGTLAIGATSVVLTFTDVTIGATSLIDVYSDTFGVNPTNVTYTTSTVTLTFDAQLAAVNVAVKVQN